MKTATIIAMTGFLIMFSFFIIYMPSDLYESGFTPKQYNIPDEFSAFDIMPKDVYIEHTLNYQDSTVYEFNDTQAIKINYCTFIEPNIISLWYARNKWIIYLYEPEYISPKITKPLLASNWIVSQNCSIVKMDWLCECVFEDTNTTRNDIELAFDSGEMNCTVYFISEREENIIGARDIVFALLSFRLPSIYQDIHPLFAIFLSVIIYIPLTFIVFEILMRILHGGGG